MNIYLIKQKEEQGYDRVVAGVVAAISPHDARECIKATDKDLDWTHKGADIQKIGKYTGHRRVKAHVILLDIHEG
jgi:hypothetical protein